MTKSSWKERVSVEGALIFFLILAISIHAFPFLFSGAKFNIGVVSALEGEQVSTTRMTGNYTVKVEENGNALVILGVDGSGTMNLPLPLDVVSPSVDGALYIQASNGADISVGSNRHADVIYQTALLTTKLSDLWNLEMELPKFRSSSVIISMPTNIQILETSPQAWITQTETSTNVVWEVLPEGVDTISMQYRYVQPSTISPPSFSTLTVSSRETVKETSTPRENKPETQTKQIFDQNIRFFSGEDLIVPVFLVLLLSFSVYYFVRTKSMMETMPSKGIANVMKTLTKNEHIIVDILLENDGEIKRNKLERTSSLAKSSLASSLYRLEERSIVEIDKSRSLHYVKLTGWFRSL